jgi:hypothetical protein
MTDNPLDDFDIEDLFSEDGTLADEPDPDIPVYEPTDDPEQAGRKIARFVDEETNHVPKPYHLQYIQHLGIAQSQWPVQPEEDERIGECYLTTLHTTQIVGLIVGLLGLAGIDISETMIQPNAEGTDDAQPLQLTGVMEQNVHFYLHHLLRQYHVNITNEEQWNRYLVQSWNQLFKQFKDS